MFVRNAIMVASLVSLVACESTTEIAADPNTPADDIHRQVVDSAALGISGCAAFLSRGEPLSNLASRGFKKTMFGSWKAGTFNRPIIVYETDGSRCETSYHDNIRGINGGLNLAAQTLSQEGYSKKTRTSGSGKTSIYFVKSGSEIEANVSFGTVSGAGKITIILTN